MAEYNFIRIQGEANEADIETAINNKLRAVGIQGMCENRNKFVGGKYESGFSETDRHKDMEIRISFDGKYIRQILYPTTQPVTWLGGYYTRRVEAKFDTLGLKHPDVFGSGTGNLVAETHEWRGNCYQPSGILTSTSDWWVYRSITGHYWVVTLSDLRQLAYSGKPGIHVIVIENKDTSNVPCLAFLIPIKYIEEICIDKGEDINNIDIVKMLYGNNINNWIL